MAQSDPYRYLCPSVHIYIYDMSVSLLGASSEHLFYLRPNFRIFRSLFVEVELL